MPPSPGDRLGPYEIIEPIGKGGMGEVYRARDSRVGREVAIKTSLEQFGERFEREARAIAALNHPNICTLFDVGPNYLVMELVEGTTVAARIAEGPIPLDEALRIARQIADALEAAHDKGIVHRDLKPGNVILKADGSVKVLDFGLAKRMGPAEAGHYGGGADGRSVRLQPDLADSPTLSMAATQAGVILGTAAYMSPEQARGKVVDKRADIWAFGVLLYEMVTGRRLFQGEDLTETLASVVKVEPDLSGAPPRLRRLLAKCLAKDPRNRLRDIGDAWELVVDEVPGALVPAAAVPRLRWVWPAAAAVMAFATAVTLWAPWREASALAALTKLEISPPPGTTIGKFAVSPDGRKVAYFAVGGANTGLWVRSLDDVTPVRIGGSDSPVAIPSFFWSADSRFVAFPGGGVTFTTLMVADSAGGPAEKRVEASDTIVGGAWGHDGVILIGVSNSGVWRTSSAGSQPVQLTSGIGLSPILLPDGKHFLYYKGPSLTEGGIYVGSIDARPAEQSRERLVATPAVVGFVPSRDPTIGYLLFRRDDALLAQTMDLGARTLTGTPTRIASGVGSEIEFGGFSASTNGVLVYHAGSARQAFTLRLFDRRGEAIAASPSATDDFGIRSVRLSPDGSRAAIGRPNEGEAASARTAIWLLDFARNWALSRLTSGSSAHVDPVWSPDGGRIAYVSIADKGSGLAVRSSSSSGAEEVVLPSNGRARHLNDWSRDGRLLLYSEENEKMQSDLWVVPVGGGGKPEVVLNSEFNETQGQLSPDGKWIAYVSDETGQPQVYIQPFPPGTGTGRKIAVASDSSLMPRWRRDGKELFYVALGAVGAFSAVDFAAGTAGVPRQLFQLPAYTTDWRQFTWDVSPSGDRFLLNAVPRPQGSGEPLTVVLNWQRMLQK